jgi:hypothetical protein
MKRSIFSREESKYLTFVADVEQEQVPLKTSAKLKKERLGD